MALATLLALASPPLAAADRQKAVDTYQRALRLRAELESRPQHTRPAEDFLALIRTLQAVQQADPAYEKSPEALADAAQLREEMGWEFSEKRHYADSIKAYEFLIAQYPGSGVSRDALFTIGEIYRVDLNEPDEAGRVFKKFLAQYPDSAKARLAREKLNQIEDLAARERSPSAQGRADATTARRDDATSSAAQAMNEAPTTESPAVTRKPGSHELSEVTGVHFWVGSDYTRVVIALRSEVKFTSIRLSHPDRLVFDLSNSRLSRSLAGKTFPVEDGFLRQVRVAQYQPTITRAVLDVNKINEYSVFSLPNPFRLVIDIHGGEASGDYTQAAERAAAQRRLAGPPLVAATHAQPPVDLPDRQPATVASTSTGPGPNRTTDTRRSAAIQASRVESLETEDVERTEEVSVPPVAGSRPAKQIPAEAGEATPGRITQGQTPPGPAKPVQPPAEADAPGATRTDTLTRVLGLKIGRIVIDAGHGGHDTGTIGPHGLREKDLVLDVGLRLRKLLARKTDADVVMTRSDDTFVPLEERTAIANQKAADLFISIHANASRDRSARGIETYYLSFTSDPHALEVAARENASSAKSVHELQSLIKKIVLTEKLRESHDFADAVQGSVYSTLIKAGAREEDRGVKRAPFVVLIGANMPSILAEISFVTNPRDEKLLRRPEYRQKIAEALYRGVERYTHNLGGIRVAEKEQPPDVPPPAIAGAPRNPPCGPTSSCDGARTLQPYDQRSVGDSFALISSGQKVSAPPIHSRRGATKGLKANKRRIGHPTAT